MIAIFSNQMLFRHYHLCSLNIRVLIFRTKKPVYLVKIGFSSSGHISMSSFYSNNAAMSNIIWRKSRIWEQLTRIWSALMVSNFKAYLNQLLTKDNFLKNLIMLPLHQDIYNYHHFTQTMQLCQTSFEEKGKKEVCFIKTCYMHSWKSNLNVLIMWVKKIHNYSAAFKELNYTVSSQNILNILMTFWKRHLSNIIWRSNMQEQPMNISDPFSWFWYWVTVLKYVH